MDTNSDASTSVAAGNGPVSPDLPEDDLAALRAENAALRAQNAVLAQTLLAIGDGLMALRDGIVAKVRRG